MRIIVLLSFLLTACSFKHNNKTVEHKKMSFTEAEILHKLDLAFNDIPDSDFPAGDIEDIKYNFFPDLEHGYCETAGSKIHLYADKSRWAIVFEKCGYYNRSFDARIELIYIGNCIDYVIEKCPERNYISNMSSVLLITADEYERIGNKEGNEMENFELINPSANEITVRGQKVKIDHDTSKYIALGIHPRTDENPDNLIAYEDIVRYFSDANPSLVSATEPEIKQHIPKDIPKLMTLDKFHFVSAYDKNNLPDSQETYQLIAKILETGDTSFWKPRLKPNNHWTNWESGNL